MESSLTTIGPHYIEARNPPQPRLIGKSISHDPHVPLHFRHVGNTTHIEDILLLDILTPYDSSYHYDIILLLCLLIPPHDVINDSWPFIAIGYSHAYD